ncbi:hypothetical protein HDV01_000766 [Terramyces sp. JEL0728]|nr:hypothetical protein HDV01_000766 [Terramyces sp. JEL0728]
MAIFHSMRISKKLGRGLVVGASVATLLVLITVFCILNVTTANEKQTRSLIVDSSASKGILALEVLAFDFHQGFSKVKMQALIPNSAGIIVDTGVQAFTFTNDSIMPTMFVTFPLDDAGFPFLYPFDNYSKPLINLASTIFLQVRDSATKAPIPLTIVAKGHLDSWSVHFENTTDENVTNAIFAVSFVRNRIAKLFAFFIFTIMWLLCLAAITVAFYVFIGDKKVEPPIIAVTASLLFALPAIRNVQPGAPVVGCTLDVAGFFFNMGFVALSFLILVYNYLMKTREERLKAKGKDVFDK